MRICLFVLLFTSFAVADDKLTLPPEIRVPKGKRLAYAKAETAGKKIVWRVPEAVEYRVFSDGKELVAAAAPGRYPITAITAIGDEPIPADSVLVFEGDADPLPPPIPPDPIPPPADPLRASILKVYESDTSPTKAKAAATLAELYRQFAVVAGEKETDSAARLFEILVAAANGAPSIKGQLMPLREIVRDEMRKILPATNSPDPLTSAQRIAAASLFTRLAGILEGIK